MVEKRYEGLPVSGGVVLGLAVTHWPGEFRIPFFSVKEGQIEQELTVLDAGMLKAAQGIEERRKAVSAELGQGRAAIFEAHLCLLTDPVFIREIKEVIIEEKVNSATAVYRIAQKYQQIFREMEDPYLRERAVDIEDVAGALLREILGDKEKNIISGTGILIAQDLTPSEVTRLDRNKILGLATVVGAPTSHVALLAKGWQLPAIMGCGEGLREISQGTPLILDGDKGILIVDPEPATLLDYRARVAPADGPLLSQVNPKSRTVDGQPVILQANVNTLEDLLTLKKFGAQGVGLYRSEYLFFSSDWWPGEEEQVRIYRQVIEGSGSYGATIRTIDIGADKPLAYLTSPQEANPALGLRGIRWALLNKDICRVQFRAILRAGAGTKLKVMLPMVGQVEEVLAARELFAQAEAELRAEGAAYCQALSLGIMIEIPAAVMIAPALINLVDFFSLGTNDLTQYALAVDRQNQGVAHLYQSYHPAVLQMLEKTAQVVRQQDKQISLCGELAGDPLAVPLLLGLGIYNLSMIPSAIPQVREIINCWSLEEAREVAAEALTLAGPEEVKELLSRKALNKKG